MAALIVQRRKIKQSEKRILLAEIGGIQFFSSLNVSIMSQYYAMLHRNVSGSKKLCAQCSSDIFPRYGQWQLLKLA